MPSDPWRDFEAMLNEGQLIRIVNENTDEVSLTGAASIDALGTALVRQVSGARFAASPRYWEALKVEIWKVICTNDPRYDDLRTRFRESITVSHTSAIAVLATALTMQVGLAAAVLTPLCALVLVGVLKVGKESYCSELRLDAPLPPEVRSVPQQLAGGEPTDDDRDLRDSSANSEPPDQCGAG